MNPRIISFVALSIAFTGTAGSFGRVVRPGPSGTCVLNEAEKEEKIAIKDLPAKVVAAVEAAMPGGKITDAEKQTTDGKTSYELDVESGGTTYEVVVSEEGKVLSKKVDKGENDKDKQKKALDAASGSNRSVP